MMTGDVLSRASLLKNKKSRLKWNARKKKEKFSAENVRADGHTAYSHDNSAKWRCTKWISMDDEMQTKSV